MYGTFESLTERFSDILGINASHNRYKTLHKQLKGVSLVQACVWPSHTHTHTHIYTVNTTLSPLFNQQ